MFKISLLIFPVQKPVLQNICCLFSPKKTTVTRRSFDATNLKELCHKEEKGVQMGETRGSKKC